MTAYIIRRLIMLPLILLGVTLIVFSMMMVLGPDKLLAAYIDEGALNKMTPAKLEKLKDMYGLNDPLPIQYLKWLGNTARGDLGWSRVGKAPVLESIMARMPSTIELALYSMIPIIGIGIWLGVMAAIKHNTFLDQAIRIFAIIGWSIPEFVLGIVIIIIFYSWLGWFPPGSLNESYWAVIRTPGYHQFTHLISIDALLNGRLDIFWDAVRHLIGPVLTLTYVEWAYLLRITRSSMLEVLRKDYVRTARAKGLSEDIVINRHAKRNALIPVVTVAGQIVIALLTGVIVVETIFDRAGLGQFAARAAGQLDNGSIMGALLFSSALLIIGNLIIDILYGFIDPRIRFD